MVDTISMPYLSLNIVPKKSIDNSWMKKVGTPHVKRAEPTTPTSNFVPLLEAENTPNGIPMIILPMSAEPRRITVMPRRHPKSYETYLGTPNRPSKVGRDQSKCKHIA